MRKFFIRPLFVYGVVFIVLYFVVIPVSVRRRLRHYFFLSQVPVLRGIEVLQSAQRKSALSAYSKSWWIEKSQKLLQENAYLKWQIQEQKDVQEMAQNILKLNQMKVGARFHCLPAHVIFRSLEAWSRYVIVNRGSEDGVRVGQGVLCTSGVVGRIREVQPRLAFVELISDPHFRMLVRLDGSTSPYTFCGVEGMGETSVGQAKITNLLPEDEGVGPRRVETSDLGQQFPNHIYVGQCVEVYHEGNQWVGHVQLGDYLRWLDDVGILIPTVE